MWDLIVSVPDHCLSFYFKSRYRSSERNYFQTMNCTISSLSFNILEQTSSNTMYGPPLNLTIVEKSEKTIVAEAPEQMIGELERLTNPGENLKGLPSLL